MKFITQAGGREIVVEIDDRDRDFDQFCIAVAVDGKERSAMWFTDHRSDSAAPPRTRVKSEEDTDGR